VGGENDAPQESPKSVKPFQPEVGVGVWSALNLAPAVSFGGTAFGGVGWRSLAFFAEVRKNLAASSNGVAADILVGAIVPCVRYAFLFACADFGLGELRLKGDQVKTVQYAAVGGRLGGQVSMGLVDIRLHIDVLSPIDRTIVMLNESEAWRLPAVSAALGVDTALHF
jgi:hypothetical protein